MVNLRIIKKEMINYMKIKSIGLVILGILLFLPFLRISYAQNSYVGIQNGDEFEWALSVHTENWDTYMMDDMGTTIENLIPLGSSNLTKVFKKNSFASYQFSLISLKQNKQIFNENKKLIFNHISFCVL